MSKNAARIFAVLFTIFSLSAAKESVALLGMEDSGSMLLIALPGTAGFIWAAIHFWRKSNRRGP